MTLYVVYQKFIKDVKKGEGSCAKKGDVRFVKAFVRKEYAESELVVGSAHTDAVYLIKEVELN